MFSLLHQVEDLAEPSEVDPFLRFQWVLFEERNNPFDEVIQPPNPVRHAISMIGSNDSATEKFLQGVEQLNITSMLNDGEFGEHLKLAGH